MIIGKNIKTKYKFMFIIVLAYFLTMYIGYYVIYASIPSNIVSGYLSGNYVPQNKTKWCWVASAENVCIYENQHYYNQYYAVNYLKGTGADPFPNVSGSIYESAYAIEIISSYNLNYIGSQSAKTFAFISEMIYNDHPVIAAAGYYNDQNVRTGGHAVIIIGWANPHGTPEISYYDSLSTGSYHTCTFSGFCNGTYNGRIYDQTCYFLS